MRTSLRGLLIAAVVSAPLGAATAAPAMQLAQNNSGPNLFALYQQIQQLQQQVRDLNGQVDTLQYQLDQQKQGQRDLYQDIDKRLAKLESGNTSGVGEAGANAGPASANVDPAVQSAYMAGFNKLKDGDYPAATDSFKQFVQQNPETELTPNAWYWMGEAYYVQQKPDEARRAFEMVVNRFAASPKVADSLYKIGLIQASSGENDNAQATFKRVVSQYPDSDVASQAKSRLSGGS